MNIKVVLFFISGLVVFSCSWGQNIITTVAGTGIQGYNGDHIPAIDAELDQQISLAIDRQGNFYIDDKDNFRIRKVDTAGIITTIAGTGVEGYNGDNILADSAEINYVFGIAVDGYGNVYFGDYSNSRLRKIDTNGIITTIAGNGIGGFNGDSIMATNAQLNPWDLTIDKYGNFYFTDSYVSRIRKVSNTGIVTTIAGNGISGHTGDNGPATAAEIKTPYGITVDSTGNIYFSEYDDSYIRKVDVYGIITTIAGTGAIGYNGDSIPATAANIYNPTCMATDRNGNLFFADTHNYRVREIDTNGMITTVAGYGDPHYSGDGGSPLLAGISPSSAKIDNMGNLYISDLGNSRIRYIKNTTGIRSVEQNEAQVSIFPNPSVDGAFFINIIANTDEAVEITIATIIGCQQTKIQAHTNELIQTHLAAPGMYLINIQGALCNYTGKIEVIK